MIYKPKNFKIEELVPEKVFNKYGDFCWTVLNPKILYSVQELRDHLGKSILLNDWKNGGKRHNQVLRTGDYYGRLSLSQHLFANAADCFVEGIEAQELREIVVSMKKMKKLEYITGIEKDVSWLHFDCGIRDNLDNNGLYFFGK